MNMRWFAIFLVALCFAGAVGAQAAVTERASVATGGVEANNWSNDTDISADGRYVVFHSPANNLVPGDTNSTTDVFVRDRDTGATERVSVASDGSEANGLSWRPSISADGRYVAFSSDATNLVAGDTNGYEDVFVRDRQTGTTVRVSVASDGEESNFNSGLAEISGDGRYVAFTSGATNLADNDDNDVNDLFVHDLQTGTTERANLANDGSQANAENLYFDISADGRYVVFTSLASNLVAGDTNGVEDVFVRDRQAGTTERVSVATDGSESNGTSVISDTAISADGRFVVFVSTADNLVAGDTNNADDAFIRDRLNGTTGRINVNSSAEQADADATGAAISGNGKYIAYYSAATNLAGSDPNAYDDIFVYDRNTGQTEVADVADGGAMGNADSWDPSIDYDGRCIAFISSATNLVSGDTNSQYDAFVRVRWGGLPRLSDPAATPASGDTNTVFTFAVTYKQTEKAMPQYVYVAIRKPDGSYLYKPMQTTDTDPFSGMRYTVTTKLAAPGVYQYYFYTRLSPAFPVVYSEVSSGPTVYTAPALSSGGVSPIKDHDNMDFTFSVTCTQAEDQIPADVEVVVTKQGGAPVAYPMTTTDITPVDGSVYSYKIKLGVGKYSYYFTARLTANTPWVQTAPASGPEAYTPPVLSGASISPLSADSKTTINFNVTYTQAEKAMPQYVYARFIDQTGNVISRPLSTGATNPAAGMLYKGTATLPAGTYRYFFYTRLSPTAPVVQTPEYTGLAIVPAPTLTEGTVSPSAGAASDNFTFEVTYKQANGTMPQYVYMRIVKPDGSYIAKAMSTTDTDAITGCRYSYTTKLAAGAYKYYFYTRLSPTMAVTYTATLNGPTVN
ncbi:MAG: PD40 domain-containing protein [Armatimonadetes bacterium]|nr:PD40 domain-containing protein [Armatimonadota bacterium]